MKFFTSFLTRVGFCPQEWHSVFVPLLSIFRIRTSLIVRSLRTAVSWAFQKTSTRCLAFERIDEFFHDFLRVSSTNRLKTSKFWMKKNVFWMLPEDSLLNCFRTGNTSKRHLLSTEISSQLLPVVRLRLAKVRAPEAPLHFHKECAS